MQMVGDARVRGDAVRGKGVSLDSRKWSTTLFGCMEWEGGLAACALAAFCSPCEYASARTFEGDQAWWINCCCYSQVAGAYRRGLIRARLGIQGGPVDDCAVHCFCSSCAMAQELLELQVLILNSSAALCLASSSRSHLFDRGTAADDVRGCCCLA